MQKIFWENGMIIMIHTKKMHKYGYNENDFLHDFIIMRKYA